MLKSCKWCFTEFTAKTKVHKYCSRSCAHKHENARYRLSLAERAVKGDARTLAMLAAKRERKNAAQRKKWAESAEYRAKQYKAWRSWYVRNKMTEGIHGCV